MPKLMTAAVLHQQMPPNEIRQAGARLQVVMPGHGATWSKLGACQEIADLLKRSTVLERNAHEAGYHVVEADEFSGAVESLHAEKDFGWLCVIVDTEVERALAGNADFLRDVGATVGKGKAGAHRSPRIDIFTILVPTWCQTTLIHADLGAPS
ncbi:MAG: hypothetical protein ABIU05_13105 [Nitrospirales bacterium]